MSNTVRLRKILRLYHQGAPYPVCFGWDPERPELPNFCLIGRNGKDSRVHAVFDPQKFSRYHLSIQVGADGRIWLIDQGSRNGFKVNDVQVTGAAFFNPEKDRLIVCDCQFLFTQTTDGWEIRAIDLEHLDAGPLRPGDRLGEPGWGEQAPLTRGVDSFPAHPLQMSKPEEKVGPPGGSDQQPDAAGSPPAAAQANNPQVQFFFKTQEDVPDKEALEKLYTSALATGLPEGEVEGFPFKVLPAGEAPGGPTDEADQRDANIPEPVESGSHH